MDPGCLHMSPVDWDGAVTEILPHVITPVFFANILMCL